jgi:Calx-beta domain
MKVVALLAVLVGIAAPTASATIPPDRDVSLSVADVMVTETNVDIVADVLVTLSDATTQVVTVRYRTADGSADATDYVPAAGTLTFPRGTTTAHIPVLIKGDALDEPDETLFVDLSDAQDASIDKVRGTVTIVDDDPPFRPLLAASVAPRWDVHKRYTRVLRMLVQAPGGAVVTVECTGKGCPFDVQTSGIDAAALFRRAKLRPGAVVRIFVDAPGMTGRVFQYTVRRGKAPLVRTYPS